MHAMLLAAGRGERMRPLTDTCPKPLLKVAGRALIDYQLDRLANAGVRDVVINVSWLAEQLVAHCGTGDRWGLRIHYSEEHEALETAGGIIQALPQLGTQPFLIMNADVWTDFSITALLGRSLEPACAHLVMVDNPVHHPNGDFCLRERHLQIEGENRLTFSGIGLYHPAFFAGFATGRRPLLQLLNLAMQERRLFGEHHDGIWTDVGTPERLATLNEAMSTEAKSAL